jgi:hypothetical protein
VAVRVVGVFVVVAVPVGVIVGEEVAPVNVGVGVVVTVALGVRDTVLGGVAVAEIGVPVAVFVAA